jgi:hypothetical protein
MSLDGVWEELEEACSPGRSGHLLRRIHPESDIDLFLALAMPGRERILTLRVTAGALEPLDTLPAAKGLECRIRSAPELAKADLELVLTDNRAVDVFTALADDVASAVAPARDDAAAVRLWTTRLARWQRLLDRASGDGLSPERQRGLYAELWVLRQHLIEALGSDVAVQGWTGPLHASHDFEFARGAVEVKATAGKQHQVLRIASERQLDDVGVDRLFLCHLSLDVRQGPGETLVEAVARTREQLADDPHAPLFEDRLFEAGYLDAHARRYEQTAYALREQNFFRVESGFPRIVESDLVSGVGDVSYSVAVAECKHWSVADDLVMTELRSPNVE